MWALLTLASCSLGCGTNGAEDSAPADPRAVVAPAQSGAPDAAAALALRAQGSEGLRQALERYDAADRSEDPQGWESFIDTVGAARDTSVARLFWETDLERAKAESKRRGLPILSLRMLGDLRDELSCANSRFFRTTLYADPDVSRTMREEFVLHWSSEREVPVVEITFGDGRAIKTTTTGNSIHYLLDSDGQVLDAAPGLYSPGGFALVLGTMQALAQDTGEGSIRAHHGRARTSGEARVSRWLTMYGPPVEAEALPFAFGQLGSLRPAAAPEIAPLVVPAMDAQRITASKGILEVPTLRALGVREATPVPQEQALDQVFEQLRKLGAVEVLLSEPAQALMRRDRPRKPGESESEHEARFTAMGQRFRSSIAIDELKNEYDLRLDLHQWLSEENADRSFEAFNERVYRELFLTPPSDPWLGLVDDETYDGLLEAGISRMPG